MIKVRAKCWINYNGVWHKGGEVFEVTDFAEVKNYADPAEQSEDFPQVRLTEKKRGRPRKAE